MWRSFSSGLVCAVLVTLLVAWGQGLERVVLPEPGAIVADGADDGPPPRCCEGGTGLMCQASCMAAKVETLGSDRSAAHPNVRAEELEHLDGRRPTPEPMPPEAARA